MQLSLVRDYSDETCTLGVLTAGALALQTLELPWIPNPPALCGLPERSCVPASSYQLVRHDTKKHPHTWALVNRAVDVFHELADMPPGDFGRTAVLIHVGNFPRDSLGCILVGRTRERMGGEWMVGESRDAFTALQAILPWDDSSTLSISYSTGARPS